MRNDAVETFKQSGLIVNIYQDEDAEGPWDRSDTEAFIVTTKNRYFQLDSDIVPDLYDISDEIKEKYHIYPLYAYIHGGIALSLGTAGLFSDPWDSGRIGSVFITKDTSNIPEPENYAEGMIEDWSHYLSGQVYGYEVTDKKGNDLDSCWGFYGLEYAKEEARQAAKNEAAYRREEKRKIAAMMHL